VTNCTPRDAGTPAGRRAADWICAAARQAGAAARVDSFVALSRASLVSFANVVAEFPGSDPAAPWIVLISHFDTMPGIGNGFQGANDGASTTGLLLAFTRSLSRAGQLKENVMLAWTDAEECRVSYGRHDGFQGSRRLVEQFAAKRRAVKAAICLDMLGDRSLHITVPGNGTPALRKYAVKAAEKAGVPQMLSLRDAMVVGDDHGPFLKAGCPVICLIDFDYGTLPGLNNYWHTPLDTIDKISADSLYVAGRITAELVNLLVHPVEKQMSKGGLK
jgi:Zn-dependent M28 family amino/carboxypeptidase